MVQLFTGITLRCVIGSNHQPGIVTMTAQCDRCVFAFANANGCAAFPNGIPAEIADGKFDHSKPYLGDSGIRFIPRRDERLPGDPHGTHHLSLEEWTPSKEE
jgi:hypothetical protein